MLEDVEQYLPSNTMVGKGENTTSFTNVGRYDRNKECGIIRGSFPVGRFLCAVQILLRLA